MKCRNCGSEDAYQGLFGDPECNVVDCKFFSQRRLDEIKGEASKPPMKQLNLISGGTFTRATSGSAGVPITYPCNGSWTFTSSAPQPLTATPWVNPYFVPSHPTPSDDDDSKLSAAPSLKELLQTIADISAKISEK